MLYNRNRTIDSAIYFITYLNTFRENEECCKDEEQTIYKTSKYFCSNIPARNKKATADITTSI